MDSAIQIFKRILDGEDVSIREILFGSSFSGDSGSDIRIASLIAWIMK